MIILAIAALAALVAQSVWYSQQRLKAEAAWTVERRELLNRIQAPHVLPTPQLEPLELPEPTEEELRQRRAWQQIGEVVSIDDSYGRD